MDGSHGSGEQWSDLNALERAALVGFLAADQLLFLILPLAFFTAVLEWRLGGTLIVVVLVLQFLGKQLGILAFWRRDPSALGRQGLAVDAVSILLLAGGVCVALAGSEVGAYLVVAGVTGRLLDHLVVGVTGYRAAMARPWAGGSVGRRRR